MKKVHADNIGSHVKAADWHKANPSKISYIFLLPQWIYSLRILYFLNLKKKSSMSAFLSHHIQERKNVPSPNWSENEFNWDSFLIGIIELILWAKKVNCWYCFDLPWSSCLIFFDDSEGLKMHKTSNKIWYCIKQKDELESHGFKWQLQLLKQKS